MHGSAGAGGTAHVTSGQFNSGGGCVEVQEHILRHGPADAAALVRDLDGDVVGALHDVDVHGGDSLRVLMELHGSSHTVLEYFEEHVVKMAWDVDKIDLV